MEGKRSTTNSIQSIFIVPAEHSELPRQINPQVCGDGGPLRMGDQPISWQAKPRMNADGT